jgi:hypothetical protein
MAKHKGRASANPQGDVPRQLKRYLQFHNPHLTNISLTLCTPTEDWDTRVMPPERWYDVSYTADDRTELP